MKNFLLRSRTSPIPIPRANQKALPISPYSEVLGLSFSPFTDNCSHDSGISVELTDDEAYDAVENDVNRVAEPLPNGACMIGVFMMELEEIENVFCQICEGKWDIYNYETIEILMATVNHYPPDKIFVVVSLYMITYKQIDF